MRSTSTTQPRTPCAHPTRAFTLIELLVTVTVLAIAASLVIPSMSQTDVLRVQSAVRQTVADITFAQTDAMAYQQRRAIWFSRVPSSDAVPWEFAEGNGYTIAEVTGPVLDLATNALFHPDDQDQAYSRDFDQGDYGSARVVSADFDGDQLLIFDELGGPVQNLTGASTSNTGTIRIVGGDNAQWRYDIIIAPMTGRVSVNRLD